MTIDSATGLIQWTPSQTHVGDNNVNVQVLDGRGGIDTQSFTISVLNTNDSPEITSTSILNAKENIPYTYDVDAFDINGDTLTFTLEVAPPAMSIDSTTGLIEWTAESSDIGAHTIKVKATNPFAASDTQEYTLTVEEITDYTPPRISEIQIAPLILNPGETATITIDAIDNEAIGSYELQVDGVYITPTGNTATYTYDEIGNKISQTDANGNTTTWEYDSMGRVIKRTLPLGMSETKTYDAAGNMITKTDFNADTITYTYDNNNRLILKTYPDSSTVSFAYTPTGQRASILDSRGLTTFVYDERDRLIQRTDPDGAVISYTYDDAGNRTSVTVPSGTTVYSFDELNRLLTVTDPDAGVTAYTYDAIGNRASVTYTNGTKAIYTYNTLNRLIVLENRRSDGSIISSYAYTLGPSGNRIRVQENTGRVVDYTYDVLYRLIQEGITDPSLGDRIITYIQVSTMMLMWDSII